MSNNQTLHIIFDGPPSAISGRFVEVENDAGESVNAGEWNDLGNGLWELVIERPEPKPASIDDVANLCYHGCAICAPCDYVPSSWKVQP